MCVSHEWNERYLQCIQCKYKYYRFSAFVLKFCRLKNDQKSYDANKAPVENIRQYVTLSLSLSLFPSLFLSHANSLSRQIYTYNIRALSRVENDGDIGEIWQPGSVHFVYENNTFSYGCENKQIIRIHTVDLTVDRYTICT